MEPGKTETGDADHSAFHNHKQDLIAYKELAAETTRQFNTPISASCKNGNGDYSKADKEETKF